MGRCRILVVVVATVLAVLSACRDAGEALRRDARRSTVSMDVGAEGEPLGELLRREPAAGETAPLPVPAPDPAVLTDGPARRYREVRLGNRTLGQLCVDELGGFDRWREVMTLNHWTEPQVERLGQDQLVRLPPF